MNIERLKKYNQKLLALLGSILVLMAFVGLIMMIVGGISELKWMMRSDESDSGILSDEKIEELQQEKKRQQVISYDFPRLIDTINLVYIIPVRHQTLNAAEYIDEEVLGLLDMYGNAKTDSRYSRSYYGSFNNLMIYDLKQNSLKTLFDERINFSEIRTEQIDGDIIILFTASHSDTYKDGVINLKDMKSLYVYSLSEGKLRKISAKDLDIQYYGFVEESKDLLIRFGVDYDKNGLHNDSFEPSVVMRYDYDNDKLINIVDLKLHDRLQKLLEGSEK